MPLLLRRSSFGVGFAISLDPPGLRGAVSQRLPPCCSPARPSRGERLYRISKKPGRARYLVEGGSLPLTRADDLESALSAFESDLQLHIAERARGRIFVHAGVVGWRGRAILIPGPSFSGKTNLVVALARAGATYYSDEYAVIDARGRIHPYPRPLATRRKGKRWQAKTLGLPTGRRPLPAGLVVLSHFEKGATWRPKTLSRGRGLLALLQNTVAARSRSRAALRYLDCVLKRARVLAGARGEAAPAAAALLASLG
jgi:hypothetical protein